MKKLIIFSLIVLFLIYLATPNNNDGFNENNKTHQTKSRPFRIVEVAPNVLVKIYEGQPGWKKVVDQGKNATLYDPIKKSTHDMDSKSMMRMPGPIKQLDKIAQAKFVDVDFYGKFVNQYDEPIPEVYINLSLSLPQTLGGWKKRDIYTRTDSNGQFHLTGFSGEFFSIKGIQKDSYFFNEKGSFGYSRNNVKTSLQNPYVFKGWRLDKNVVESNNKDVKYWLATSLGEKTLENKYYTVSFDPLKGRNSFVEGSDGDIVVWATREYGSANEELSYEFKIQFKNGGLIQRNEQYPYMAPLDGYQSELTISKTREDADWKNGDYEGSYYFMHANGKYYGLFKLYIRAFVNENYIVMGMHGNINTSGRRRLLTQKDINRAKESYDKSSGRQYWNNR